MLPLDLSTEQYVELVWSETCPPHPACSRASPLCTKRRRTALYVTAWLQLSANRRAVSSSELHLYCSCMSPSSYRAYVQACTCTSTSWDCVDPSTSWAAPELARRRHGSPWSLPSTSDESRPWYRTEHRRAGSGEVRVDGLYGRSASASLTWPSSWRWRWRWAARRQLRRQCFVTVRGHTGVCAVERNRESLAILTVILTIGEAHLRFHGRSSFLNLYVLLQVRLPLAMVECWMRSLPCQLLPSRLLCIFFSVSSHGAWLLLFIGGLPSIKIKIAACFPEQTPRWIPLISFVDRTSAV
jgi:hypothetical protein